MIARLLCALFGHDLNRVTFYHLTSWSPMQSVSTTVRPCRRCGAYEPV